MSPSISIVVPGIRADRWISLYNSILKSTKRSFELIICGPFFPSNEFTLLKNFKFIKDFGSPVRASMLAVSVAEGDFITWAADDAVFLENSLDTITDVSETNDSICVCKYLEGKNGTHKPVQPNSYFSLNGSYWTNSHHFGHDWYLFNTGIMSRKKFLELGGWDCIFEGTFYSHSDLAARAYIKNYKVMFDNTLLLDCDHFTGETSDHQPVEDAQVNHDMHVFKSKYNGATPNISIMKQWSDCPAIWNRRFK